MFSIKRIAETSDDHRPALDALLAGVWNGTDIGRLERVDITKTNTHAWRMWQYQDDDSK